MEILWVVVRILFALYVGWCLLWIVAVWLGASGENDVEHFYRPEPQARYRKPGFSDAEILDPSFPDPRMKEGEHRPLRHMYYRRQVEEVKRKKAILPYGDGWVGILWSHLV